MKNKANLKIMILGATSGIAQATAKKLIDDGHQLVLVARDAAKVKIVTDDLATRGTGNVYTLIEDLNDITKHDELITKAKEKMNGLDVVLIAYGSLSNQKACELSYEETQKEILTNYLSAVSFLTRIANIFEKQQHGTISVISSVAGDRGRQSNYIYGSAKGGLSIFLQGLRNRLSKFNVNVQTIKPGFVDTPMTQSIENKGVLWASADKVGGDIVKAIYKNKTIVYTPGFWRLIMFIVRSVPERVFMRLSL